MRTRTSGFFAFQHVNPFRQVQRCGKILGLGIGQGDFLNRVTTGIILLDCDAVFEEMNDNILAQRRLTFVDKGDNRGVKFVLDTEHDAQSNVPAHGRKRFALERPRGGD